jgi:uncharacterized protein (TIGR02246 family)
MGATTEAVTALLAKYNEALNASSTEAVMPLYAEDGVFMPPYSQSAIGSAAVRKAYDAVFKAITLNVKFTIAEIVELGPGWAFARTNSAGTTTDQTIPIGSRLPLCNVGEAHAAFAKGSAGKILLLT